MFVVTIKYGVSIDNATFEFGARIDSVLIPD